MGDAMIPKKKSVRMAFGTRDMCLKKKHARTHTLIHIVHAPLIGLCNIAMQKKGHKSMICMSISRHSPRHWTICYSFSVTINFSLFFS